MIVEHVNVDQQKTAKSMGNVLPKGQYKKQQ